MLLSNLKPNEAGWDLAGSKVANSSGSVSTRWYVCWPKTGETREESKLMSIDAIPLRGETISSDFSKPDGRYVDKCSLQYLMPLRSWILFADFMCIIDSQTKYDSSNKKCLKAGSNINFFNTWPKGQHGLLAVFIRSVYCLVFLHVNRFLPSS